MSEREILNQLKADMAEKFDIKLSDASYSEANAETIVKLFFSDGLQPKFFWVTPFVSSQNVVMRKINELDSSKLQALMTGSEESITSMIREHFKWIYVCGNPETKTGKISGKTLAKWTPCRIEHFLEVLKQNDLTLNSSEKEGLFLKSTAVHHANVIIIDSSHKYAVQAV